MNKHVLRIQYYTRKIVQLGAVHPTKRNERWSKRLYRLLAYKKAMHEQLVSHMKQDLTHS
ncbi:hypothetical protein [Neobacillus sp. NPDC093127]|uniref:hypothetical protein n=1 Tax=Neobacillus sp. NPDC093127 TaxID=3364296 RepID=UPI003820ADC9